MTASVHIEKGSGTIGNMGNDKPLLGFPLAESGVHAPMHPGGESLLACFEDDNSDTACRPVLFLYDCVKFILRGIEDEGFNLPRLRPDENAVFRVELEVIVKASSNSLRVTRQWTLTTSRRHSQSLRTSQSAWPSCTRGQS